MNNELVIDGWKLVFCIQENGHLGTAAYRVVLIDDPSITGILKVCLSQNMRHLMRFHFEDGFAAGPVIADRKPLHYGRGTCEGHPYFVQEEVGELPDKLPDDELVPLLFDLLDILIELEKARFLHGDVKPANMGRRADGSLVLFDFSCTLDIDEATHEPIAVGTDYFQASEAQNGHVSVQSEIFSHARTGYFLAAEWKTLRRLAPAFLMATEKDPDDRPENYADYRQLLVESDGTYLDAVRLHARHRRQVVVGIAVVFGVAIAGIVGAYGWLASCNNRWRLESHRVHCDERTALKSQIENGFDELGYGDRTNGLKMLEDAADSPAFRKYRYREAEVYNALHYCHSHGVGTETNKVKGAFYRRKARELKRPVGP